MHIQQANGALIAAAPDMYEALEAVLKDFHCPDCPDPIPMWLGDKICRALSKARGET